MEGAWYAIESFVHVFAEYFTGHRESKWHADEAELFEWCVERREKLAAG